MDMSVNLTIGNNFFIRSSVSNMWYSVFCGCLSVAVE